MDEEDLFVDLMEDDDEDDNDDDDEVDAGDDVIPGEDYHLTLQQLFERVPSPPKAVLSLSQYIRTDLFQYQLDSISRMIAMEEESDAGPDETLGPVRGGILCENMGTGKTLMVIGLVAATLDKPARLLNERWQVSVGQQLDWTARSSSDGSTVFHEPPRRDILDDREQILSLIQLALCSVKVKFQSSPDITEFLTERLPHLEHAYKSIQQYTTMDFIHHSSRSSYSRSSTSNDNRSSSSLSNKSSTSPTHKIHLSKTTLIVMPDTLIDQWTFEFNKHVLVDTIQLKIIKDPKDAIPGPFLEDTRFGFEFKGADRLCRCQYKANTNIVDCQCDRVKDFLARNGSMAALRKKVVKKKDDGVAKKKTPLKRKPKVAESGGRNSNYVSPLIQVQFQRLVFDEGHLLKHESGARKDNKLLETVSKLKAHWKWVCSGTPLPNILESSSGDGNVSATKRKEMERVDLKKLGGIVTNFLKVEPFAFNKSLFSKLITIPWFSRTNEGIQKVQDLLNRLIVRHSLEEIQLEHPLPPLTEQTIFLDMNQQERINVNLITAQIKLNSILTEKEGKDYFGDPSQRKALHEVVNNMQLCLFHFNGNEIIGNSQMSLKNALYGLERSVIGKKAYNIQDLSSIVSHLQRVEDQFYETYQEIGDVSYIVKECRCLWRSGGVLDSGKEASLIDFRSGRRLLTKQQIDTHCKHLKSAFLGQNPEVLLGTSVATRARADGANVSESKSTLKKRKVSQDTPDKSASQLQSSDQTPKTKKKKTVSFAADCTKMDKSDDIDSKPQDASFASLTPEKSSRNSASLSSSSSSSTAAVMKTPPTPPPEHPNTLSQSIQEPPAYNFCTSCQDKQELTFEIEGSTCTKMTYIGDQILKYYKTEKIIVYTTHDNEMFAVKEFCELFSIQFRLFQKTKQRMSEKSANVNTFNTAENIRVMIMDVTKGGFGLDLSAASRIYFMRPIVETALYKQAIKRAHRLGCTKPVFVEVVAFRGTLEAQMGGTAGIGGGKRETADVANLKMKDLIEVAPFVDRVAQDGSQESTGLPNLFAPQVMFSTPFQKRIGAEQKPVS
ncbi:SNF2 family N-terminal domain-containing protein [Obelidium mucronatum]|nr:SNF2 family N-terminal domain-containing protein [Obelidium mucronatum]